MRSSSQRRAAARFVVAVAALLAISVGVQAVRDRLVPSTAAEEPVLYLRSGEALARLALSFDALLADVYWIRTIQYYGGLKRQVGGDKTYALLDPLLDIVTTLDPRFNVAYRFGAIFLTEAYPNGPGRPDQAIELLQKGIRANPDRWQYYQDIGFIHYWWLHDYEAAGTWFGRGAEIDGAPWWLRSLAATTLARGGNRQASRTLWTEMAKAEDNEWLQREAGRRLLQFDALDVLDRLNWMVYAYTFEKGAPPDSWRALVGRDGLTGVPVDPTGTPYVLGARELRVRLSTSSPLYPLPTEPPLERPAVP